MLSKILGWFTQTKKKPLLCNSNNANVCKNKYKKITTISNTKKDNKIYKSVKSFGTKKYKWSSGINTNTMNIKQDKNIYYIHDNGSRPFKVHIKSNYVYIYKGDYVFNKYFYEPYMKVKRRQIFIGINPPISGLEFDNYPGNTILLEYDNGNYLFIEREVYIFKPDSKITEFYSYVGNNDVPYAYARDNKYTYLFAYKQRILTTLLNSHKDPYAQNLDKDASNIVLSVIKIPEN